MIEIDVEAKLTELIGFFAKEKDVLFAYLYGSYALGKPLKLSDIDIAVFFDYKIPRREFYGRACNLSLTLTDILKPLRVDVRELNSASPFFRFQVLKGGKLLYSRDEEARIHFEIKTRNEYFDLLPMFQEYFRERMERIKRGEFGVR